MTEQGNAPFFAKNEKITLNRNGIWLSDGIEITHEPTRRLFARSLRKDDAEGYYLHIGREALRVEVEDTPYFVIRIDGAPSTGYELRLNDETSEPLSPETLRYQDGRLSCRLQRGEEAKFLSAPYFDLLRNIEEDPFSYFLSIRGKRVDLEKKN